VQELEQRGVSLRATEQPIDTSTAAGRCFLQMLGVFAEFETAIRKERQMEGISKAKAEGRYKGRPASIDAETVRKLHEGGMRPAHIAKHLGIGRASVYRALDGEVVPSPPGTIKLKPKPYAAATVAQVIEVWNSAKV
jgi:DNA invertase Pin-like site-specific DNA recombinase